MAATLKSTPTTQRTPLSMSSGILARLGFGAFAASLSADEPASASTYGLLLAGSGGKFTDSLERDADLRLRGDSGAF